MFWRFTPKVIYRFYLGFLYGETILHIYVIIVMGKALSASEREIRSLMIDSIMGMVEPMRKRR